AMAAGQERTSNKCPPIILAGAVCDQETVGAEFGRALNAMAIRDQPPKSILMPMRRPSAHRAVPGRPAKRIAPNPISTMPLASIQAQPRDSRLRCLTAYMIDTAPSTNRNAMRTTVNEIVPLTGDARRRAPVTIPSTAESNDQEKPGARCALRVA